MLNAVTDDPDKLYDTVLVTYNFQKPPEVKGRHCQGGRGQHRHHCNEDPGGGYQTRELYHSKRGIQSQNSNRSVTKLPSRNLCSR